MLLTIVCFFAAYWNSISSNLFGHLQFEYHCSGILASLLIRVSKEEEVTGLYNVISLIWYSLLLCQLAL